MVNFSLSVEETAIREMAHAFAEKEIRPIVAKREWIHDAAQRFPWDIVEKGSNQGFRTMTVPREFGGPEASMITVALVLEELAWGDLGVATIFHSTMNKVRRMARLASEEQKRWFFPRLMQENRYLLAGAVSEPAHGSDFFIAPEKVRFDTTAKRDGKEWVLNGTKHFITNGSVASLYLVTATDTASPQNSRVIILVPKDTHGVRVERVNEKISQRFSDNAEISFIDCRVPVENELGTPASRRSEVAQFTMETSTMAAAMMLGVARAAYESALSFAKEKTQSGKRIIEHQAVGMMLAEMATNIESMRTMVLRSAWEADQQSPNFTIGAMTKYHVAESSFKVCTKALETFGGSGIMLELPIQKYLRDSLSAFHFDGTQQATLLRITNALI